MEKPGSAIGRTLAGAARSLGRSFLSHPAGFLAAILGLLALWTGLRIWMEGFPGAIALLPNLAIYLLLIVAVVLARKVLRGFLAGLGSRAEGSLARGVARGVVQHQVEEGKAVLRQETDALRASASGIGADIKTDWQRAAGTLPMKSNVPVHIAPRCPTCHHLIRRGARFCDTCGAVLQPICPQCGRQLRAGASFCDGCGAHIRPAS